MHSLEAQWLMQTIIPLVLCPELESLEMLCTKPWCSHPAWLSDVLTSRSFHAGYKTFTCPPAASGSHCGWCSQQAASGWYSPSAILGGNCREQRRKGGEEPAGDAEVTREHVRAARRAHGGGRRAAATARPPRTSQVRLPACPWLPWRYRH